VSESRIACSTASGVALRACVASSENTKVASYVKQRRESGERAGHRERDEGSIARESAKGLGRVFARDRANELGRDFAKGSDKGIARGTTKGFARGIGKGIAKGPAKAIEKGLTKGIAKDPGRDEVVPILVEIQ